MKKYRLIGMMANKNDKDIHVALLKQARYTDHYFRIYKLKDNKALIKTANYIRNYNLTTDIERKMNQLKLDYDLFFDEIKILPIIGDNLIRIFINNEEGFTYYQIVNKKGKASSITHCFKTVKELEDKFDVIALVYKKNDIYSISQPDITIKKLIHNIFYWTGVNKLFYHSILTKKESDKYYIQ